MEGQDRATPQQAGVPVSSTGIPNADDHLKHLLVDSIEEPWYKTFPRSVKETLFPPKLPPLEVTSKPVAVKDIWGDYRYGKQAGSGSLVIHVLVISAIVFASTNKAVRDTAHRAITLVAPNIEPYMPDMAPKKVTMGGGGGGGDRSPLPASKGQAPKMSWKQFTPPLAVRNNDHPKLEMEPTLIGPPDAKLPQVNMPNWGDPLAKVGPPSNGTGTGGGIGNGTGTGIGPGKGPGFGPGEGGGFGGGVFRVGGGVSAPVPLHKVEPEYSEEARKAKFQGTVVLAIIIDEQGVPRSFKIVRALGLGLDEKAIEAVKQWRFKPGMKGGQPVAVAATVEVNFRLL